MVWFDRQADLVHSFDWSFDVGRLLLIFCLRLRFCETVYSVLAPTVCAITSVTSLLTNYGKLFPSAITKENHVEAASKHSPLRFACPRLLPFRRIFMIVVTGKAWNRYILFNRAYWKFGCYAVAHFKSKETLFHPTTRQKLEAPRISIRFSHIIACSFRFFPLFTVIQ